MPFEPAPKTDEEQRIQMGRIALEAIAAHILTVAPENFNMSQWCGTACCAIGHGMSLREVQATGLQMVKLPPEAACFQSHAPALAGDDTDKMGPSAIGRAFGITQAEAAMLFSSIEATALPSEKVSARIRQFLAGELKPSTPPPLRYSSSTFVWHSAPMVWMSADRISQLYDYTATPASHPAPVPAPQPAKKVRVSKKNGATWPVAKHAYA